MKRTPGRVIKLIFLPDRRTWASEAGVFRQFGDEDTEWANDVQNFSLGLMLRIEAKHLEELVEKGPSDAVNPAEL
jgi:hypothetical protein